MKSCTTRWRNVLKQWNNELRLTKSFQDYTRYNVVTQNALGRRRALTIIMYPPVANFQNCIRVKNYESWLTIVIAICNSQQTYLLAHPVDISYNVVTVSLWLIAHNMKHYNCSHKIRKTSSINAHYAYCTHSHTLIGRKLEATPAAAARQ